MVGDGFLLHELSEFTLQISVCGNVFHDLQFSIGPLPLFLEVSAKLRKANIILKVRRARCVQ